MSMSEQFVRHFAAFIGTLLIFLAWLGGYISAGNGWWWTAIGAGFFYWFIYVLLDV
jgi:hypothetical protein